MPVYKDKKRNTWYCQFYYKDWTGKSKQKRKHGFSTQREAKEWERNFLNTLQTNSDITFATLVKNYMEDLATRLKPSTLETKKSIIEDKLLPYFKDMKICNIDELAVRRWQNELLDYRNNKGKPFSDTYLKTINNQLSAILNYAIVHYKLAKNPCRSVGSIGKSNADAMQIWTLDQFEQFIGYEKKAAGRLSMSCSGLASERGNFWYLPETISFTVALMNTASISIKISRLWRELNIFLLQKQIRATAVSQSHSFYTMKRYTILIPSMSQIQRNAFFTSQKVICWMKSNG